MNRNARRIALGLVAIVLGAGFLMKVIPPETDVGVDEGGMIDIDGSLVTNPLDLTELQRLTSPPLSPSEVKPANNLPKRLAEPDGVSSTPAHDLIPVPMIAGSRPSTPDIGTNPDTGQPPTSPLEPGLSLTEPPPDRENLNPVVSNAPGGGSPESIPPHDSNDETSLDPLPILDPSPDPEQPPLISLPTIPSPLPPVNPDLWDDVDSLPEFSDSGSSPGTDTTGRDVPIHQVSDSGSTAIMIGIILAGLFGISRRYTA